MATCLQRPLFWGPMGGLCTHLFRGFQFPTNTLRSSKGSKHQGAQGAASGPKEQLLYFFPTKSDLKAPFLDLGGLAGFQKSSKVPSTTPKIINPVLCMITFGQTKSDYNNKMLTITGEYNLEAFIQWDI